MGELKPCPFCGGEAHIYDGMEYVRCDTCYALMPNIPAYPEYGYTEKEAIEAWNTRAEHTCEGCAVRERGMSYYGHNPSPCFFCARNDNRDDLYEPKVVS